VTGRRLSAHLGKSLIYPDDPSVVAVAIDMSLPPPTTIPSLALDDVEAIADFHFHPNMWPVRTGNLIPS
jgi:hypothetical protein